MSEGQAGSLSQCDINITPEMIEAGAYAAREHCLGYSLEHLAVQIYTAMWTEAQAGK